jgi:hypothetical protein
MADSGQLAVVCSGFRLDRPCKEIDEGRQMKAPVKEILQYVLDHPNLTTKEAVFSYFSEIVFSLEKDEWNRLTHDQRMAFIGYLDTVVKKAQ